MRKKLTCTALFLILLLFISTSAYAASIKTYTLDDLGMSIALSKDLVVFERNFDKNDPNLAAYGLTADQLTQIFTSGNVYLNAWNESVDFEIIVTMIPSTLNDFNKINDDILTGMAANTSSEYAKGGITYIKSDIYQGAQAKFLKVYISQINNDSTVYGLQYYTVVDGKAINITMQSYAGKISSTNESYLKTIVDSAVFEESTISTESEPPQTDSFVYTDSKTNTTFTVPAGWVEKPDSGEILDAKFVPDDGSVQIILYSCFDTWNVMTPEEKVGYTRADINNSYFKKSDIADIVGISASEVSMVTYNGVDYYKCETETADNSLNRAIQMTVIFNVSNGYIYMFQFAGTSSSQHYAEFEALLSSVRISSANSASAAAPGEAAAASLPSSKPAYSSLSDNNSLSGYTGGGILLSLLITVIVYSLPIALYRFVIRQSPVKHKTAKRISIIYGICAFFVMCLIIYSLGGSISGSGAIILWSWVNYKMLIHGLPKEEHNSTATSSINLTNDDSQSNLASNEPPRQNTYMDTTSSLAPSPAAETPDIPSEHRTEEHEPPDTGGKDTESSSWGKPLF